MLRASPESGHGRWNLRQRGSGTKVPPGSGTGAVLGDQAEVACPGGGLGTAGRAELAEDSADVFLDRVEVTNSSRRWPGSACPRPASPVLAACGRSAARSGPAPPVRRVARSRTRFPVERLHEPGQTVGRDAWGWGLFCSSGGGQPAEQSTHRRPRVACPAGPVSESARHQGVRVLRAKQLLPCIKHPLVEITGSGIAAAVSRHSAIRPMLSLSAARAS